MSEMNAEPFDVVIEKLATEFSDIPVDELRQLACSVSPRMSETGRKVQARYRSLMRAIEG